MSSAFLRIWSCLVDDAREMGGPVLLAEVGLVEVRCPVAICLGMTKVPASSSVPSKRSSCPADVPVGREDAAKSGSEAGAPEGVSSSMPGGVGRVRRYSLMVELIFSGSISNRESTSWRGEL